MHLVCENIRTRTRTSLLATHTSARSLSNTHTNTRLERARNFSGVKRIQFQGEQLRDNTAGDQTDSSPLQNVAVSAQAHAQLVVSTTTMRGEFRQSRTASDLPHPICAEHHENVLLRRGLLGDKEKPFQSKRGWLDELVTEGIQSYTARMLVPVAVRSRQGRKKKGARDTPPPSHTHTHTPSCLPHPSLVP